MPAIEDGRKGCFVRVKVQAGRGSFRITRLEPERVRVTLRSAADKNRANEELVKEMSRLLGADVEIRQGATTPARVLFVRSMNAMDVRARLEQALAEGRA
jgi:uncharacterized protein (TIGR00251 family)